MPEAVTLSGAFMGPATCLSVPAKSTDSVSARLVTVMRILNGRSVGLALLEHAVAVAELLEARGAVGQRGQHRAHHALGVVDHLLHDLEQAAAPYFLASSWSRVTPRRFAAICARKSPRRSSGVRTLVKMMASTSVLGTPALARRTGGRRRPSP